MDSVKINTGEKQISINDDPTRVIVFNPNDRLFIDKFYNLIHELQEKSREFEKREADLLKSSEVDEFGAPVNFQEVINLQKEVCVYLRERIDHVFGNGTSQTVFGDSLNPDAIAQFLEGVTPFITKARQSKINDFSNFKTNRRVMK